MDKITEEVLTSLIKRVDELEERLNRISTKQVPNKDQISTKPGMITPGQFKYIRILEKELGIEEFNSRITNDSIMTKGQAGKYIDDLLKEKNKRCEKKVTEEVKNELHTENNSIDMSDIKPEDLI